MQKGVPRAIWYGLEFLRYVTTSKWLKERRPAFLRGYNTSKDFDRIIKDFSKTAKKCGTVWSERLVSFCATHSFVQHVLCCKQSVRGQNLVDDAFAKLSATSRLAQLLTSTSIQILNIDLLIHHTSCSKLRYYGNFVPLDMSEVKLYGVYDSTNNDSDQHVYTCAPEPCKRGLHGVRMRSRRVSLVLSAVPVHVEAVVFTIDQSLWGMVALQCAAALRSLQH